MNEERLGALLRLVEAGRLAPEEALEALRQLPFAETLHARVDRHRELRQGMAEVVFGEGKTAEQIVAIVGSLRAAEQNVLVTRVGREVSHAVRAVHADLEYHAVARCLSLVVHPAQGRLGRPIAIVTGGTSDVPVAEEAALTLEQAGEAVIRLYDVGVAGVHRLLAVLPELDRAAAVIAVAGMEGALASVVGGLVRVPVVAVPTSVGYGVALSGMTALCGMLTSCAAGVSVVNIDNGFGAAMAVLRMAQSFGPPRSVGAPGRAAADGGDPA